MSDISPCFKVITGNFNINYGVGLIIGKKRYISPDPFISSLRAEYSRNFVPANSGNPSLSFYGVGSVFMFKRGIFEFSVNSFLSGRRRFIKSKYYESGAIESSLSSISQRYKKDPDYTEPVLLNDRGSMFKAALFGIVTLEAFFFETFIEDQSQRKIFWGNFSNDPFIRGIGKYFTSGLFLQFRDDYISLFCESGKTFKKIIYDNNRTGSIEGYGFIYGIKFKNRRAGISFIGKNTTREFYAPYSSGRSYPVRSWLFNSAVRPADRLKAGTSFSSEKKLISGNSNECLPSVRMEKYFLKYTFNKRGAIKLSYNFLKRDSGGEISGKKRFKGSADLKLYFVKLLFLAANQRSQRASSWEATWGIFLKLYKSISLKCIYSRFFITEGNPIYADNYKDSSYLSSGSSVDRSVNRFSASIEYKEGSRKFSLRYEKFFAGRKSLRRRLEFSGKMIF